MCGAAEWLQGQAGTSFELAPVGFAPQNAQCAVEFGFSPAGGAPGELSSASPESVLIPSLREHNLTGKGALLLTAVKSLLLLCRRGTAPLPTSACSHWIPPRDRSRQCDVPGDRSCRRCVQPVLVLYK